MANAVKAGTLKLDDLPKGIQKQVERLTGTPNLEAYGKPVKPVETITRMSHVRTRNVRSF